MKTLRKVLTGVIFTVLISGCATTQPRFNPTPTNYVTVQGKYYIVPRNVDYTTKRLSESDAKHLSKYFGMNCKKGDIRWMSKEAKKTYNEYLNEDFKKAVNKGLSSCSRPLSNQKVKQLKAYAAQQQKINNDPRVVAAKIQANAIDNAALSQQMSAYQQQKAMQRMYNQQMMQNNIYNNNQMLMWQNNQFYRNLNTINNNTAAWWRYTH